MLDHLSGDSSLGKDASISAIFFLLPRYSCVWHGGMGAYRQTQSLTLGVRRLHSFPGPQTLGATCKVQINFQEGS